MENPTHLQIVQMLANGINPITGDNLEQNSVYHHPDIIRALFAALRALEQIRTFDTLQNSFDKKTSPENAGKPWNQAEDTELCQKFDEGVSIRDLSHIHHRTNGAIRSRLIKLGKITTLIEAEPPF